MNLLRIIWPSITNVDAANKASKYCFMTVWGLSIISVLNLVVSYVWIRLISHKEFSINNVMIGLFSIVAFLLIGYFIKKNSKVAVVIPMVMMIILGTGPNIIIGAVQLVGIVFMNNQFKPVNYGSWYGIASALILTIIYINGIRGVFAYHNFLKIAVQNQRTNDEGRWTI